MTMRIGSRRSFVRLGFTTIGAALCFIGIDIPIVAAGGNGFAVSLMANVQQLAPGHTAKLTATTNADVGPTPYYISIYDQTAHTELTVCGSGTVCSAYVSEPVVTSHTFTAYVGDYPAASTPPGFILATSQQLTIVWSYLIRPFPFWTTG